jgi:hypothetical protein
LVTFFLLLFGNKFFWHESYSCDRNFPFVTGIFYKGIYCCDWNFILATNNLHLWQQFSPSERNFIYLADILFFCQELYSCDIDPFILAGIVFWWKELCSCDILANTDFCDKVWDFQQRFRVRAQDFVSTWLTGWPGLSHPASNLERISIVGYHLMYFGNFYRSNPVEFNTISQILKEDDIQGRRPQWKMTLNSWKSTKLETCIELTQ